MKLRELKSRFSIVRLAGDTAVPNWAKGSEFLSVTRTAKELSIICDYASVPLDAQSDGPWVCLELLGPFDLALTGIAIQIIRPVSDARIGFLFVTTFDTDYILVKEDSRLDAIHVLEADGISVVEMGSSEE